MIECCLLIAFVSSHGKIDPQLLTSLKSVEPKAVEIPGFIPGKYHPIWQKANATRGARPNPTLDPALGMQGPVIQFSSTTKGNFAFTEWTYVRKSPKAGDDILTVQFIVEPDRLSAMQQIAADQLTNSAPTITARFPTG